MPTARLEARWSARAGREDPPGGRPVPRRAGPPPRTSRRRADVSIGARNKPTFLDVRGRRKAWRAKHPRHSAIPGGGSRPSRRGTRSAPRRRAPGAWPPAPAPPPAGRRPAALWRSRVPPLRRHRRSIGIPCRPGSPRASPCPCPTCPPCGAPYRTRRSRRSMALRGVGRPTRPQPCPHLAADTAPPCALHAWAAAGGERRAEAAQGPAGAHAAKVGVRPGHASARRGPGAAATRHHPRRPGGPYSGPSAAAGSSAAVRNPICPVLLSAVFEVRAATR